MVDALTTITLHQFTGLSPTAHGSTPGAPPPLGFPPTPGTGRCHKQEYYPEEKKKPENTPGRFGSLAPGSTSLSLFKCHLPHRHSDVPMSPLRDWL